MSMAIIRFVDSDGHIRIGLSCDDGATYALHLSSISDVLERSLDDIRRIIESSVAASEIVFPSQILAPIDNLTEVWAAGVTYKRSKVAREEESGHADVYSRVYNSERPELFFKSVAWRVSGPTDPIGVRPDSEINTPEPEIAIVCNSFQEIIGVTICNDVSSRSIEGENPLYLPQAKVYAGSCAIGPGIIPIWEINDIYSLSISVSVQRGSTYVWEGETSTSEMHRSFEDLVRYLFMNILFPHGVFLSTGTGIVPEMSFTLTSDDVVNISIDQVGELSNKVKAATPENFPALFR